MIDQDTLTAQPIHDLLRLRWSPRAFADRPVEPEKLRSVLEAARWAPSAANQQPWHFVVARREDSAAFERLLGTLMEGNVRWAKDAPVLLLVVAKQYTDREGNATLRSLYDAGLAVGNLSAQATALGLHLHQMGGFHHDKAREALRIPDGYEPVAMIALGYLGDHETLPDDLRQRELAPRSRKPLQEFVFTGQWGEPALELVG